MKCKDAIIMPSNYAVMDEEKMTYLEGGKFYGIGLTAAQCGDVATTLGVLGLSFTITSLAATVLGYIPGLQVALAATKFAGVLSTTCTIGWAVFDYYSRNNAMRLGFEASTKEIVYSVS